MNRREFACLLGAVASAPASFSFSARNETDDKADTGGDSVSASGFNNYTEDWAHFCATPADERVFYAVIDGRIVSERLDNQIWHPTNWHNDRPTSPVPDLPIPGGSYNGVPMNSPIPNLAGRGPYKPNWDSLLQYECPEWYRDAKFGIWNHWSPECVPEDGDAYAEGLYREGSPKYQFQVAHYGHPSRFGYKDICPQWTLLNWEPSELMDLYVRAGARIFLALANHHINYDTWNSQYNPWNAMIIGPHRDVIGTWAAEARKRNLRFGVTEHAVNCWWLLQISHSADATGPFAGISYDGDLTLAEGRKQWWQGFDPQQLYCPKHPFNALPDVSYVKNFYDRTRDLIEQFNPDLLYFDTALLPVGWGGMNVAAYYYNHSLALNGGKMEGVINVKQVPPNLTKAVVYDIERGVPDGILPYPWQSETCIGDWHYDRKLYERPGEYGGYLPPDAVVHMLADAVSKNGTFILNVPGKPDGTIDAKERLILERIGTWLQANGEAIYATRPWTVFGEGPHRIKPGQFKARSEGDRNVRDLDASDVRYTRSKDNRVVYAIVLGWPQQALLLRSLGSEAEIRPGKVTHVELLGSAERIRWQQTASALRIEPPREKLSASYAVAFKLSMA